MTNFYTGGSGPIDWPRILEQAQKRSTGDPVTGEYYILDGGQYQLFQGEKPVRECGNQIAVAFDAATRMLLKHGDPEEVEQYAITARKAYAKREDDIRHLAPTLVVVWMPPGFDPEEINRVLANPAYLLKLMAKAQKIQHLEGDAGQSSSPPALPSKR
jgi:hypothetical protein